MPTKNLVPLESLQNYGTEAIDFPALPPLPQLEIENIDDNLGPLGAAKFAPVAEENSKVSNQSESVAAAGGKKRGRYKTFSDRVDDLKAYREKVRPVPLLSLSYSIAVHCSF